MLYMVIENFKEGSSEKIYRRFSDKGRMIPQGLKYLDSWVESNLNRCFQLMETEDYSLFANWTENWNDLVSFEIIPVIKSSNAGSKAMSESRGK